MTTFNRWLHCSMSLILTLSLVLCGIRPSFHATAFQSTPHPMMANLPRTWTSDTQTILPIMHPPSQATTSTSIHGFFDEGDELVGQDKLKACIPYVLPLLDGDFFGSYIYDRIPPLKFLHELLLSPFVSIFDKIPFVGIILLVILSIRKRNTNGISCMVWFNAQQAVLIDVVLSMPTRMVSVRGRAVCQGCGLRRGLILCIMR